MKSLVHCLIMLLFSIFTSAQETKNIPDPIIESEFIYLEEDEGQSWSEDQGRSWSPGMIHITYTWNRKVIKHVVVDPSKIYARPLVDGAWPKN